MDMPTILLVDDTKLLLEIEKSFLEKSPVRVLTATNGEEALKILSKERPDLVILDQNMPIMNGATCCAAIRRDPDLRNIPVLMISSAVSREDREMYSRVGCTGFMAKPLDRQRFLSEVRAYLPAVERREPRVPCRTAVSIESAGMSFAGTSENISLKGMFVATSYRATFNDQIALQFRLPGAHDTCWTTVKGRVAWINSVRRQPNQLLPPGFGVEFLEITGEGLAILRKTELYEFIESFRQGGKR
jgi:CheY-like chemotaxis protein/Tfp pilus assembly protein PilZ